MAKQPLELALLLKSVPDSGIESLEKGVQGYDNVDSFPLGDGKIIISPFGQEVSDIVEESAFDLDLETTRVKLILFNKKDKMLFDDIKLNEAFASQYRIKDNTEDFELSLVADFLDFINDNQDMVESEIDVHIDKYYAGDKYKGADEASTEKPAEDKSNDETTNEDKQQVEESSQSQDGEKVESTSQTSTNPSDNPSKEQEQSGNGQENDDDGIGDLFGETEKKVERTKETVPEVDVDPLLIRATKMFDQSVHFELPNYDENTHRELQQDIVNVQNTLANSRVAIIQSIYQRLVDKKAEIEKAVQENLEPAKQKHENVLNVIDRNKATDVNKDNAHLDTKYNDDRDKFIQAQLPALQEEYDSKHLSAHKALLETTQSQHEKEAEKQKADENEKFSNYVKEVTNNSIEAGLQSVNISNELQGFRELIQSQLDELKTNADKFDSQVSNATSDLIKENEKLLNDLNTQKQKLEVLQSTTDERIDADVKRKVNEQMLEANLKIQQLSNQNEKLSSDLKNEKTKSDSVLKDLSTTKERFADLQLNQTEKFNQVKNNQAVPINRVPQTTDQKNVDISQLPARKESHQSNGFKAIVIGALVFILVMLALIAGFVLHGSSASQNSSSSPQTIQVSSDESSSTSDTSNLKKGDTFKYRTSDGKKVTITVDGKHSGHYTDSDGKYHTVVFN